MPDWKTTESYQRLLAATMASQDLKLNFRQIAKYYGEGTTYHSIEARFRIVKEHAMALKAKVDSNDPASAISDDIPVPSSSFASNASETTPTKPRSKKNGVTSTPTPKKGKVLSGRVAKTNTPRKAAKATSTNHDGVEASGTLGMDGSGDSAIMRIKEEEEVAIMRIKEEEVTSSENDSYLGNEEVASDVDAMDKYIGFLTF